MLEQMCDIEEINECVLNGLESGYFGKLGETRQGGRWWIENDRIKYSVTWVSSRFEDYYGKRKLNVRRQNG